MIEVALFLQVAFFALVCLAFVASRGASFFHPLCLYLLFHLLVFVIRPIMSYALDFDFIWRYMEYTPSEQEFVETLFLSSAALLVFAVSVVLAGRSEPKFSVEDLPHWTIAEKRAFVVVGLLLGPLAVYSGLTASAGASFEGAGDVQMTRDLATGIAVYTNTTGYIAESHAMLGALCILFLWRGNFRPWAYGPFLFFIFYRAFLGWGRWAIITSVMSLILIYLYRTNSKWLKLRYLVLAIPVAVLFQSLGMNRDLVRDAVEGSGATNRLQASPPEYLNVYENPWQVFDHPDFANFEFLSYVIWVVPEKSQTYTYFTQYLQLFTEPIPRMIWSEKPVGAPIQLINLNDYGTFTGMTTSLVGDGWMSFGWLGVIITMGFVGFIMGRVHRWFWHNQHSPRAVMTYCIFLPLSIQWYRDGGISIAKFALFTLTPILLWGILSKVIAGLQEGRRRVPAGMAGRLRMDRRPPPRPDRPDAGPPGTKNR